MASLRQRRIAIACMLGENLEDSFCASLLNPPQTPATPSPPAACFSSSAAEASLPAAPFRDTDQREHPPDTAPHDTPTFAQAKQGRLPEREVGGVARKISSDFELCSASDSPAQQGESLRLRSEADGQSLADSLRGFSSDEFFHLRRQSSREEAETAPELSFLKRKGEAREPGQAGDSAPRKAASHALLPARAHHARRSSSPKQPANPPPSTRKSTHSSIRQFDIDQTTHLRRYVLPKTSLV